MASIRRLLPGLLLFAAVAPIQAQGIGGQACYYARGKKAGSAVKPCWDKSYGISHCCQAGDLCLSDLSCWDPDSGATYQYGCTDPDYIDDNCPKKCGLDTDKAPWVGLMYCGEGSNLWVCNHPDTCGNCSTTAFPPNVQSMPPEVSSCKSLQMTAAAFVAEVSLTPILSLPTGLETETLYFSPTSTSWIAVSGYTPTWITDAASATSSAASTDNDDDDESSSSSGLSTAAKAGIGAGVGVVALAAIGAAVFLLLRKRRGHKEPATLAGDPDVSQPMISQSYGGAPSPVPGVFYDYRSNTGSPDLSSHRMSHPTYGTPSSLNSTTSPSQTPYQDSYTSLEQQHGHIHPQYTGQTHVSELPVQRDNLHELA